LRGAASVTVALGHFFLLFPQNRWTPVWKYSPLYALIAGREAVVVFFVLSGFALHRMLQRPRGFVYWHFALRRVIRIYGPYLGALTLAMAGNFWLSEGPRAGFNDWFNTLWPLPVQMADVKAHVLFVGDYDTARFNGAFWSLVHEMRISLLFPLLDWLIRGRPIAWGTSLAALMIVTGSWLNVQIGEPNNLGETLHYAGLFAVGILIAERSHRAADWISRLSAGRRMTFAVGAAVLFYYGRGISRLFPATYSSLLDLPVGLGAALIVTWAVQSRRLLSAPMQWLGKRSFSLYLVHVPALLGLVDVLHLQKPSLQLVWLYVPLTFLLTEAFYHAVERPMLALSRRAG
jgi:peptidoglycan/LPS O-acetylase OafA/YrhL